MLSYLKAQYEHVSYETVCSGHGIGNIYNFLKDSGHAEEPNGLRLQLAKQKDPNPIIIADAMKTEATAICKQTVDIFISILAAEAGNLALKLMATGGIYIGGGIPPRIISALRSESFVTNFRQKGRFEEWMTQIPIHVILHPKVALLGATCYGMSLIEATVS